MAAFEYKVNKFSDISSGELDGYLNTLGLENWELVSVVHHPESQRHEGRMTTFTFAGDTFYFKRRIGNPI